MASSYCGAEERNVNRSSSQAAVEEPMYSIIIFNIAASAFLCYTTTMMNIVTIHALVKTPLQPKPLKTLLLSLAFSDLFFGVLGDPLQIAYLVERLRCQQPNRATVIASNVVVSVLFLSSLSSIVLISADRFIAIQMPLRYKDVVTRKRSFAVVVVIWMFSAVFSSLCYGFQVIPPLSAFIILIVLELVSFVVTTLSSCKIYLTVRRHKKQMTSQIQQLLQNGDSMIFPRSAGEKSSHGTLLIYLLFWLCYLPHLVISIVREIYPSDNIIIHGLFALSETLVLLNSSINPAIYCWKMTPIRRTILSSIQKAYANYMRKTEVVSV